jgi:hypothetical protein
MAAKVSGQEEELPIDSIYLSMTRIQALLGSRLENLAHDLDRRGGGEGGKESDSKEIRSRQWCLQKDQPPLWLLA